MLKDTRSTEIIDTSLLDLDTRGNLEILQLLAASQQQALNCVNAVLPSIEKAIDAAAQRLRHTGRLIMVGAGASGRLAVQDGAELWPTYGWPDSRLLLVMAGGHEALVSSVENVEDDVDAARQQVAEMALTANDVVVALAASGTSPWTCQWLESAKQQSALTIGVANNAGTPLAEIADCPIVLESGAEVLAGSTRMAAGTAQKIFLNLFSTTLMIRLDRTYGNLMVDMAVRNRKLDNRKLRLLKAIHPDKPMERLQASLAQADGWVKLAALVATGLSVGNARELLDKHDGSLRRAFASQG